VFLSNTTYFETNFPVTFEIRPSIFFFKLESGFLFSHLNFVPYFAVKKVRTFYRIGKNRLFILISLQSASKLQGDGAVKGPPRLYTAEQGTKVPLWLLI
jgi:hypothetical protein